MRTIRGHRAFAGVVVVGLFVLVVAVASMAGCGGASETTTTTWAMTATTAAAAATTTEGSGSESKDGSASNQSVATPSGTGGQALDATVTAAQAASGQKIISDAQLTIEVEAGKFQMVFDQALLLSDRYGGYLVSSNSAAGGPDNTMRSGTVAIRVPSTSFSQALNDASKLGALKSEALSTQDVTQEYVDLQARIKNSQAHVNALVALLGQAKTIDDILQVQSVLTQAQQDLEELQGRMRYLDEHTNYSTLTMSIYEKGTEPVVATTTGWGVGKAFKDALHYLVRVFNGIIKALGILIPIVIVLAIIGYIVYLIVRAVQRRNQRRQQAWYQTHPQSAWRQGGAAGGAAAGGAMAGGPQVTTAGGAGTGAALSEPRGPVATEPGSPSGADQQKPEHTS